MKRESVLGSVSSRLCDFMRWVICCDHLFTSLASWDTIQSRDQAYC